ncbi:uncharacterized protein LOC126064689 isoform X17 [Elephas maximus indicus]|uniref:uncharacterized protein LOC126064689 isoform X17 n=1 Tax=Elephas maximus indicus TaxID=99487 RepID=UPI002116F04A|nr:uncharacterized protein LOC126064689 isoform X17 [Elephas maximus indicus]
MAGYARLSRIPPELVDVCPSWKSFLPPVQWQLGWVNAHPHCASVTWGLLYPQGQQYLPQEGWTREESSRREVRGSPVQGRGTAKTMNWKFIPYSVRDHVYFRGNTCVLGAPPSCGPSPGSEVWMVPRDPELHRGTGGKERSHSSGPGEGPSLLRGDPYFFCWLVPHGVTGGWCPEILSSTKGQVGETEVAAQDVEQFQHFQEAGLIHLITGRVLTYGDLGVLLYTLGRIKTPGGPLLLLLACASWSNGWMVPRDPELHRGAGGQDRSHSSRPGAAPALSSSKFLKNTLIFLHYKSRYKCTVCAW